MNEKMKEILGNAFKISTSIKFNVRVHKTTEYNQLNYIDKVMTYLELGTLLHSKVESIQLVEIHTND